jgi:general secretion pathway protein G
MTSRNDTWTVEEETDTIMTADQQEPGIYDVHSGSTATGSDGTAYNTW